MNTDQIINPHKYFHKKTIINSFFLLGILFLNSCSFNMDDSYFNSEYPLIISKINPENTQVEKDTILINEANYSTFQNWLKNNKKGWKNIRIKKPIPNFSIAQDKFVIRVFDDFVVLNFSKNEAFYQGQKLIKKGELDFLIN